MVAPSIWNVRRRKKNMAEVGDAGSIGCSYDFHDTLYTTMIVDSSQDHLGSWDTLRARITLKFSNLIAMRIVNT